MSIKSELEKTRQYLRTTRKAILGRGGEISPTAGLKDLPDAIYKIPADASLAYQTDESVAYRKIVPTNIVDREKSYANIAKIGGMTYKCNNLIPYPYIDPRIPKTVGESITTRHNDYDFTITLNEDRSFTLNGTFHNAYIELTKEVAPTKGLALSLGADSSITDCEIRFVYGNDDTEGDVTIYDGTALGGLLVDPEFETQIEHCYLYIYGELNNFTIRPIIADSTTIVPYEPYFEELRDTKVTELVSEGANLFNISEALNESLIDNNDGTYTLKMREGNMGRFSKEIPIYIPANTSFTTSTTVVESTLTTAPRFQFLDKDRKKNITPYLDKKVVNKADFDIYSIRVVLGQEEPLDCYIKFKEPMVNFGDSIAPYKPYRGTIDTFTIPEELRAFLEDKGYGTTGGFIDFNRKVWVLGDNETDISAYLAGDNFIEVEGGGTITAVNEYEYDAPSTINYVIETAGT